MISERTKAALSAAKARGVKLGGDRGHRPLTQAHAVAGARAAAASRSRVADHHAHNLSAAIADVRAALGPNASLRDIAAALTARGIPTARGAEWTATAVRRVMLRVADAGQEVEQ